MQNTMFQPGSTPAATTDPVSKGLRTIAQNILVIVIGILPLLFLPIAFAPFSYTKVLFVVIAVMVALIFASLAALREGSLSLHLPVGLVALWGIVVAAIVSMLFSGDIGDALIGDALGIHTTLFLALVAVLASSMLLLRGSKASIIRLYILFIVSALILGLYHFIRILFGTDALSFGLFTTATSTPLGGWNDLALYFGLTILLAMVAVEQLPLTKPGRIVLAAVTVFALGILAVVNFVAVWVVLGLVSLVMLMYSLTKHRFTQASLSGQTEQSSLISILISIITFVVSVVFILGGSTLGGVVANATGISFIEVRPSVGATLDIARNVYAENAFTGIGPNKFIDAWRLYKDPSINGTLFWNTNFDSGNGYVTTALVTGGMIAVIAWLIFLGLLLRSGIRLLLSTQPADRFWRFIAISSFVATIYFWGMSLLYVPSATILMLAGVCTGIFYASYSVLVPHPQVSFSVLNNRNLGFVLVGMVMVVIVGSVGTMYFVSQHYLALYNFQRTLATIDSGDTVNSISEEIAASYESSNNDLFARQIAGYQLRQMETLLSVAEPTEAQRQLFQDSIAVAVNAGEVAISTDASEASNHAVLAEILSLLALTEIEGAYDRGKAAFASTKALDPHNPTWLLLEAQLELRVGNAEAARTLADEAVSKKRDYTEALFFLSQLDIAEGRTADAIARSEAIASLEPQNPARFYQLGVLYAAENNLAGSVAALERAVALDGNFANARYFLALAYADQERTDEARAQLEAVLALNPGNELITGLIDRLNNGEPLTTPVTNESSLLPEPDAVSDDGGQVTTTDEPDTRLISTVNTVPDDEVDNDEAEADSVETTEEPESDTTDSDSEASTESGQ